MQLRLDAADRLVELVEERRGPVPAEEAARALFALRSLPAGLARGLLEPTVEEDARLSWRGDSVGLTAPPGSTTLLEDATFVVVDLETTGLRPGSSAICEIGAVRIRALEREETFQTLVGLAQERGARTVADLSALAATRTRRVHDKRSLAFGAPQRPGVYLFRDRHDQVLYVGRARDLRARLRSYFRSDRQRPAVEAALFALERIEWRPTGSEVEAALEELRLLRELRPVANARNARPDRYVYLRRRGDKLVCSQTPTPLGPIRSRARARLACRALDGASEEELERPELALPRLHGRLRHLAECRRYEDAARLRDRIRAREQILGCLRSVARLRPGFCV